MLDNYLSRAITMEGLLNGRGNLQDNIRMLKRIGAKYIGRALCLWGAEANFRYNVDRARREVERVKAGDLRRGTIRSGGQVRRAAVAKVLDQAVRDKALGRHLGLVVQRLGARKPAYTVDGDGVVTPASTLKLLTSVAALDVLGPDHRFATTVVTGANKRSIVLVGGRHGEGLNLTPWQLKPGEEKIIARRVSEILRAHRVSS